MQVEAVAPKVAAMVNRLCLPPKELTGLKRKTQSFLTNEDVFWKFWKFLNEEYNVILLTLLFPTSFFCINDSKGDRMMKTKFRPDVEGLNVIKS